MNAHCNTQKLAVSTPVAKGLALLAASSVLHLMVCDAQRQQQKVGATLVKAVEPQNPQRLRLHK